MCYYLGVMSGTSLDGLDIALIRYSEENGFSFHGAQTFRFPDELYQRLHTLVTSQHSDFNTLGQAHIALGHQIGLAINAFLTHCDLTPDKVMAIGSHGHTLCHAPDSPFPFSWQLGDPNQIAQITRITTVSDFRNRDLASGGQGAPLTPAFHQALFQSDRENRAIINLGGISNITYLPADPAMPVLGFDTGPGNTLIDLWVKQHHKQPYDMGGAWAASGQVIPELLDQLLSDPFFEREIPKSTGREYFNESWLKRFLSNTPHPRPAVDIQATLTELTARTVVQHLHQHLPETHAVYFCGGGVHNNYLMQRIQTLLGALPVYTTQTLGLDPDWVEACAFAWLAARTLTHHPGNLPSVTGASAPVVLGSITPG